MLSGLLRSGRSWIQREKNASLVSVGNQAVRLVERELSSGVERQDEGFKAGLKRRVDRIGWDSILNDTTASQRFGDGHG
jgi:hypothetical protein